MGKEVNNKENNNMKVIAIISFVLVVIAAIVIYNIVFNNPNDIKKVKRVLKNKYSDISCIDSLCNGFVAVEKDDVKGKKFILINDEGKKVGTYKEKLSEKLDNEPYQLSDNYFIMVSKDKKDLSIKSYSIYSGSGKELYKTKNRLSVLNDKYILMKEDNTYSIIDKKGKKVYSNIKEFEKYADNNIILIRIDNESILLDSNIEKLISGYTIRHEGLNDQGEVIYLILKDVKNSVYNYYNINKKKIVGDSFESYVKETGTSNLIITKTENYDKVKYRLTINGAQEKIKDEFSQVDEVNKIKEKIDSNKYYLYTNSVYKNNQDTVIVDDLSSKSIGLLNIKNKDYKELYKYNKDKKSVSSTVTKLESENDKIYFQISCSKSMCGTQKTIVYDFSNTKQLYSFEDQNLIPQSYTAYKDDYKVIRYSYSSTNADYKGKYVLYDKNNKEILKSSNEIVVVDREILFGKTGTKSLILYSADDKKSLNDDNGLASLITVSNENLYKYINDKDETVVASLKGKKLLTIKAGSYLKYSNDMIIYLNDDVVRMYDVKSKITKKYKLKKNEKINDGLGDIIPPYRGAMFINNTVDKYIKVIDSDTKVIKKIKKSEISSVGVMKNNDIYIITKTIDKDGNKYGLYIAK